MPGFNAGAEELESYATLTVRLTSRGGPSNVNLTDPRPIILIFPG